MCLHKRKGKSVNLTNLTRGTADKMLANPGRVRYDKSGKYAAQSVEKETLIMKKYVIVLLALAAVFLLSACQKGGDPSTPETSSGASSQTSSASSSVASSIRTLPDPRSTSCCRVIELSSFRVAQLTLCLPGHPICC